MGIMMKSFQLKAELLLHILDYPGQNKVFRCHGMQLNYACMFVALTILTLNDLHTIDMYTYVTI